MIIRPYRRQDLDEILQLFYDTVHTVNRKDYTPEQLDAWADGHPDKEKWNLSLLGHFTAIAEEDSIILGFADMDASGYLDRLYVHHAFQGRGIATALCDKLESTAKAEKFTTHSSATALPFFKKRGYHVQKQQTVQRKGVPLTNYIMSS